MRPAALLALCFLTIGALPQPAAGQVTTTESDRRTDAHAAPPARPRVRLVATGGTISNRRGGRLTAEELVASIPGLERYVEAEAEQFTNVASSALSLKQWLELARRLNRLFLDSPDLAGIVVTCGTDTLEETAYFLDLTVRTDRPVVVVGSMRNPDTVGYEGAANLLAGFRVAASAEARGKGVLVVLNDQINAARDVTKTDALRLDTFQSRGYGLLGVVDSDRVVFHRSPAKRHATSSEFEIGSLDDLPRVDVVLVYQGAAGDVIKAIVDQGARGIVIASAGAGAVSGTQREGIQYALDRGVFVVTSSRTGSGRIAASTPGTDASDPASSDDERSFAASDHRIAAEDLAPLKARILLMLALTRTSDGREIQRMFTEY
jgi:L-asparaginase type II